VHELPVRALVLVGEAEDLAGSLEVADARQRTRGREGIAVEEPAVAGSLARPARREPRDEAATEAVDAGPGTLDRDLRPEEGLVEARIGGVEGGGALQVFAPVAPHALALRGPVVQELGLELPGVTDDGLRAGQPHGGLLEAEAGLRGERLRDGLGPREDHRRRPAGVRVERDAEHDLVGGQRVVGGMEVDARGGGADEEGEATELLGQEEGPARLVDRRDLAPEPCRPHRPEVGTEGEGRVEAPVAIEGEQHDERTPLPAGEDLVA